MVSELNELTFSRRGRALVGQKMFKIMDEARRIEEKGFRVYHLELGNPRLVPPPGCIDVTVASLERQEISYTYSAGYPPLRQAIAKLYTGRLGRTLTEASVTISPANLIISQFLDLVCDRGDRVVFFTPAFPTYWLAAAHIGLSVTGVAGPTTQDGQPAGTVFVGLALPGLPSESFELHLPGDRPRVRSYAAISALDALRRALRPA